MSKPTPTDARDLAHRTHQRLIGGVGLLLPPLLYLVAALRPTPPLEKWELLRSISAYYYTGAIGILVGLLVALALFLISYPGYEGVAADRILGKIAGISALGVALFPTYAPGEMVEPPWWTNSVSTIHFASAVSLLVCFAFFSLWLFRKSAIPEHDQRPPGKRLRDKIYLVCGVVILAALLWAAVALRLGAPVFWPEAIALWAFAFSWLVKGEAIKIGSDEGPSALDGNRPQPT